MNGKKLAASFIVLLAVSLNFGVQIHVLRAASSPREASVPSAGTSSTDWWPMFRHDLNHSGYSTSTAPNTNQTIWNFTTGGSVGFSSPAIMDGRVFVGSDDGKVYALNASTGSLIWNFATGNMSKSSPAVADGKVFAGSDNGNVYALNASTGALVWNYSTSDWVESSPAVVGGTVFVGSYDGNVYALNASTGAFLWSYKTGTFGWVESSPAVVGGRVFVGADDGKVYALDAATGAHVWSYQTGDLVKSSPAVVGGRVFVSSSDYNVYCLDASSGGLIWSYPTGWGVESSPAVVGGTVFVGSYDGNVYALNASTGAFLWSHACGAAVRRSSPAVADGKVYIGSGTSLLALNSSTGSSIWGYATSGLVYSSPAVADGTVFVGSLDGNVYAFGPAQAYQYTVATSPSGLGIVVDGTAYVSPQAFSWNSGSVHTVGVSSPQGSYFFANWSDGGGQSHQITTGSSNTTVTAYFNQEVHDVAVLNVNVSKTIVGQTYSMNINVTAANQGSYTEVLNVTAYANGTAIQTETFNITSQNSTTLTFTWNTTGFALGNYTISAYAWPVPGETNTADNNFTCTGNVTVTIPGDVTCDGIVDIYDLRTVACYFDVTDHDPQWATASTYDLNGNGVIDIFDLVLIGANFT